MDRFKAYRIHNENNTIAGRVEEITLADLSPGEVVFRCAYSGVNYKDALASTPDGKVARISPIVPGIDLAGEVVEPGASGLAVGTPVVANGYEIGTGHHGGYGELARLPADWVVPLAPGGPSDRPDPG